MDAPADQPAPRPADRRPSRPAPGRTPRLAVLGAGPIGLEAALAAARRGWPCSVYERSAAVGGHVRAWGHVRLFTPWSLNVSPPARAALGDAAPDGAGLPTGTELADRLLAPVAALPAVAAMLRMETTVVAVGREGLLKHERIGQPDRAGRPFRLLVRDADGAERIEHADVVLDCTGTYGSPNALGDGGIPAPGELARAGRIRRDIPDFAGEPQRWAGRRILLTGAGHSAQTAARDLARFARGAPGTTVEWAVRSPAPDWGAVDDDPLPERAALSRTTRELAAGASPAIELHPGRVTEALWDGADGRVAVALRNSEVIEREFDRILALNGAVGDFAIYRQLQVQECYATCGPINLAAALLGESGGDCLAQGGHGVDTLRNPEPGFFILGAKSYGRDNRFLLSVGWQQVADVFGLLDG
ncbi:MAG: flavoprotein [Solirubrobacteraceae bacterium]